MSEPDSNLRRSLRARAPKEKEQSRSGKFSHKVISTCLEDNIEEVYLQSNSKVSEFCHTGLETIYEVPKGKNQSLRDCMGVVKLKRHCRFSPLYNPSKFKIKLRKTKSKNFVKRVGVNVPTGLNVTFEQVQQVLQRISGDENEENEGVLLNMSAEQKGINIDENCCYNKRSELVAQNALSLHSSLDTFCAQSSARFLTNFHSSTNEHETLDKSDAMEDELSLGNLDIFSSKHTGIVDKSKRNRRRSGRVQPLNSSNELHLLTPLHVQTKDDYTTPLPIKVCSLHSQSPDAGWSKPLQIPQEAMSKNQMIEKMEVINEASILSNSVVNICTSVPTTETNNTHSQCTSTVSENILSPLERISKQKNKTKSKRKTRKVSGIHRSLYKTLNSTPSPKSQSPKHSSPLKSDCLPEGPSTSKLLSPSLFEQLKIHSPESEKLTKAKKVRRKSARLSSGGVLGTMWIQNRSPNTNNDLSLVSVPKGITWQECGAASHSMDLEENVFQICTETFRSHKILNLEANAPSNSLEIDKQKEHLSESVSFAKVADSPILTGIFNCAARIHKDKGLIVKKGHKMYTNHLNVNSN